jgi:hypothetical protein
VPKGLLPSLSKHPRDVTTTFIAAHNAQIPYPQIPCSPDLSRAMPRDRPVSCAVARAARVPTQRRRGEATPKNLGRRWRSSRWSPHQRVHGPESSPLPYPDPFPFSVAKNQAVLGHPHAHTAAHLSIRIAREHLARRCLEKQGQAMPIYLLKSPVDTPPTRSSDPAMDCTPAGEPPLNGELRDTPPASLACSP